ncbi:MAG: TrkH family potassium uptake protein [Thermodesulfobacteriota bacterium]
MADQRHRAYLGKRYRTLGSHAGTLFAMIGVIVLAPAALLPFFPTEQQMAPGFLLPGFGLMLTGLLLRVVLRPQGNDALTLAEGSAIVFVSWAVAIVAGAFPFCWAGFDLTRAVFESTSGWTTTGLSIVDAGQISPLLLFFRALMQFAGGAGFAILMLSLMAAVPAGVGLSTAEGHGEQLVPHIRQSARMVFSFYCVYCLAGIFGLRLAGMDWFDAVNHAFSAISTGGFHYRADSVASWNSPAVEAVLIVLMLLGAMNFLTGYTFWRGRWQAVWKNGELRLMLVLLPLTIVLLSAGTEPPTGGGMSEQLRAAIFQAVSALTTTGYTTLSLDEWNGFAWLLLIIAMLIGGGTGSTAGGIKQHRLYLLGRGVMREVAAATLPPRAVHEEMLWLGSQRRPLLDEDVRKAGLYVGLYLFTWLAGSCALTVFGHPLADSLFEFASTLGTVGLSVGLTTVAAPDGQLWLQSAGMILGRLEFFVIIWGLIKIAGDLSIMLPRGSTNE